MLFTALAAPSPGPASTRSRSARRCATCSDSAGGATEPLSAHSSSAATSARWVAAADAERLRCSTATSRRGAALGARRVVALPAAACGLAETARVARYLADESAGQCGPCVHGLGALAGGARAARRRQRATRASELARWLAQVRGRGACRHPDGAARFVEQRAPGLRATEFEHHLRRPLRRQAAREFCRLPATGRRR